jgi:hypothetical protein
MLRRTKNKEESFDYFREQDALRKHYNEVIDKAEIGSQIERCERRLERDYF